MTSSYTYEEIYRQPGTWKTTVNTVKASKEKVLEIFQRESPDEVIFIGCGTSYYISIAAALNFAEVTGIMARAVPASEIFLKPDSVIDKNKKSIIIGLSRSGNTTEVVRAIEFVQKQKLAECISITSDPKSDMAIQPGSHKILLPHVQEKSIVMTSTFTNLLLASQVIAGVVSNNESFLKELDQLSSLGDKVFKKAESLGKRLGEDLRYDHFIYLGLGSYFGLACEGMLKMKEMTQSFSESFNPLEFRHGPISVLNEKCCVVLLNQLNIQSYEQDVITEVSPSTGATVVVGENLESFAGSHLLELESGLTDQARLILYLPFLQLLAYYRTIKMGLNPDKPRNLNQVVVLKDE
ncbi:MAG TPA: SIS domain-containing protein [Bacillales bacterium]|nr:SIS domain-containing protein [Bacillales bacterium]